MRWAIPLLLAAMPLAGCVPTTVKVEPEALKVALASPEFRASLTASLRQSKEASAQSGPQEASGGGFNIGSIIMDGSTVAFVVLGVVSSLCFWRRSSKRGELNEFLVKQGVPLPDGMKEDLRVKALSRGLERELHKVVKKVNGNGR